MADIRTSDSSMSPALGIHRRRSAVRNNLALILCLVGFTGLGAWRYRAGDGSAPLFFGLLGVFLALFVYGVIHKRRLSVDGPPDPSALWRPSAGAAEASQRLYRYSRGTILAARICAWSSTLFGFVVYAASQPGPSGLALGAFILLWVVFSGCFFVALEACKRYAVEVTHTEIVHHRLRKPLRHAFRDLGSIALLQGGGRGSHFVLALYDQRGRCVDKFADTLEGFEVLVALVKARAFEIGLPYHYRDMWGAWTR